MLYRMSQEEREKFWEVIVSVILSKKVYMYMCPIPNCFRDTDILLYPKLLITSRVLVTIHGGWVGESTY
jgi:hypothetical protein